MSNIIIEDFISGGIDPTDFMTKNSQVEGTQKAKIIHTPKLLGFFDTASNYLFKMAISSNNVAFIANSNNVDGTIYSINIQKPEELQNLDTFVLPGCTVVSYIRLFERFLYIGDNSGHIYKLDVSNPADIKNTDLVFTDTDFASCTGLDFSDNYLFVNDSLLSTRYIFVVNPADMTLVKKISVSAGAVPLPRLAGVTIDRDIMIGLDDQTVHFYDKSDLNNITYIGGVNTGRSLYAFTKAGSIIVASGSNWVVLVNMEDPSNPVKVSEFETDGGQNFAVDIASYDIVAVTIRNQDKWGLINFTDWLNPSLINDWAMQAPYLDQINDIKILGNYAYIVGDRYLTSWDIRGYFFPSLTIGTLNVTSRVMLSGKLTIDGPVDFKNPLTGKSASFEDNVKAKNLPLNEVGINRVEDIPFDSTLGVSGEYVFYQNKTYIFPGAAIPFVLTKPVRIQEDVEIRKALLVTTDPITFEGEANFRSSVIQYLGTDTAIKIPNNGFVSRLIEIQIEAANGTVINVDAISLAIVYTGQTGAFTVGQPLTCYSGGEEIGTALIKVDQPVGGGNGVLYVSNVDGNFLPGELIEDPITGVAYVASVTQIPSVLVVNEFAVIEAAILGFAKNIILTGTNWKLQNFDQSFNFSYMVGFSLDVLDAATATQLGAMIKFFGYNDRIEISKIGPVLAGGGQYALYFDSNGYYRAVSIGGPASPAFILGSTPDDFFDPAGLNQKALRFKVFGVRDVPDSTISTDAAFTGSVRQTGNILDAWVPIHASWDVDTVVERFQARTIIYYNNLAGGSFVIDNIVSSSPSGGSGKIIEVVEQTGTTGYITLINVNGYFTANVDTLTSNGVTAIIPATSTTIPAPISREWEYLDVEDAIVKAIGGVNMKPVSGTNIPLSLAIAKNGILINKSITTTRVSADAESIQFFPRLCSIQQGDIVSFRIRNSGNSAFVIVQDGSLTLSKV